jgi:hypothetical protein
MKYFSKLFEETYRLFFVFFGNRRNAKYLINTEKQMDVIMKYIIHPVTIYHHYIIVKTLGWYVNAKDAVSYAKIHGYPSADGCYYCYPVVVY